MPLPTAGSLQMGNSEAENSHGEAEPRQPRMQEQSQNSVLPGGRKEANAWTGGYVVAEGSVLRRPMKSKLLS